MSARKAAVLLFIGVLGACRTEPADGPLPPPDERHEIFVEKVPSLPAGHPDVASLQMSGRATRRLSVDQIERSLDVIGNLPLGTVKLPADLAITLGRPDYLRLTEEALEPSPLFMKFMVDLGVYACNALSDLEPARPVPQRLMTRFGDDVEKNLRFMLLRFTGIEGAAADEYVPRLRAAYDRGANAGTRERGGYEATCIALFTSPEFLLY